MEFSWLKAASQAKRTMGTDASSFPWLLDD
jgi:hypothetical protein